MASRSTRVPCWKCGKTQEVLLPFSRYEECSHCKADLHVCRACKHYVAQLSSSCLEDRADFVLDREKANFCDYFQPNPRAYSGSDDSEAKAARAKLAELFGEEPPADDAEQQDKPETEAERALAELKRLFGDKD